MKNRSNWQASPLYQWLERCFVGKISVYLKNHHQTRDTLYSREAKLTECFRVKSGLDSSFQTEMLISEILKCSTLKA